MVDKETEKNLIEKAFEMKEKAYCPYSKYHVGAALLSKSGKIYGGHNIENSSYGATICAERTAVFKAVSEGHRSFYAIAIVGGLNGNITGICTPCGICRQVLKEFADENMIVLLGNQQGYRKYTLGELLPMSFTL